MRSISFVLIVVVVAVVSAAPSNSKPHYDVEKAPELFEKYIKDFKKVYKDEADKQEHYLAFVESLKIINKNNKLDHSATYDLNYLADYTDAEMKKMFGFGTDPSLVEIIQTTPDSAKA